MATRRNITPPNLPIATKQYEQRYQEQLNNTNRLFYNSITNAVNSPRAYGQFYTSGGGLTNAGFLTVPQTSNLVPFSVTSVAFNTNIGTTNTRLYVAETGVYNVQFSAQCGLSSAGNNKVVYFWLRQNGTDIPDSAGKITVSNSTPMMAAWNWVITLQEGDYIQLAWSCTDDQHLILQQEAAQTTAPARPALPAVILTITWVSPYNTSAGIS